MPRWVEIHSASWNPITKMNLTSRGSENDPGPGTLPQRRARRGYSPAKMPSVWIRKRNRARAYLARSARFHFCHPLPPPPGVAHANSPCCPTAAAPARPRSLRRPPPRRGRAQRRSSAPAPALSPSFPYPAALCFNVVLTDRPKMVTLAELTPRYYPATDHSVKILRPRT